MIGTIEPREAEIFSGLGDALPTIPVQASWPSIINAKSIASLYLPDLLSLVQHGNPSVGFRLRRRSYGVCNVQVC